MKKVIITAGEIISPLGNLQATWEQMCAGKSGLVPVNNPSITTDYPIGLISSLVGQGGRWERVKSMLDQLIATMPSLPEDTQLFLATTKGAVDELTHGKKNLQGQPWQLAQYLQDELNLSGHTHTVSGACASGTLGVIQGTMHLQADRCRHALVVGIDLIADFILAGFDSLKGLSSSGAKPFDRNRDGLSLGDGGGWILLSSSDPCAEHDGLASVEGWGVSCDATHITAPCRNGSGLKRVFDQIATSSVTPLGGINSHGTGTHYNDAMELLVFGDKCEPGVPMYSGKGAIGHSLGASGVIETMLSVKSLAEGLLPPTVGLLDPEKCTVSVSGEKMLSLRAPSIISCNSGFGGINAAVKLAA